MLLRAASQITAFRRDKENAPGHGGPRKRRDRFRFGTDLKLLRALTPSRIYQPGVRLAASRHRQGSEFIASLPDWQAIMDYTFDYTYAAGFDQISQVLLRLHTCVSG